MGARWLKSMSPEEREQALIQRHEAALERGRKWYWRHHDTALAKGADKRQRLRPKQNLKARERYASDPIREWARKIKQKFKLSVVQWLAMFAHQGERCARCGTDKPGGTFWHTDHEHDTSTINVRGILCNRCNLRLGMIGNNYYEAQQRVTLDLAYMKGHL